MFQVRIHGRGGQGAVTAAELLSVAAFAEGRHAQAFPTFGSERTGAPVVAYCRIADSEIRLREPIVAPDALIVQDATLLRQVNVLAGLRPAGYVIVNSARPFDELGLAELADHPDSRRLITVPATELALEHLGLPKPNAVLLGGFAALTGAVSLAAVQDAIAEKFPADLARRNAEAARAAYELVRSQRKEPADASTG